MPELAAILDEAIALHDAHMSGAEPPTPESQGRLAGLLQAARAVCMAEMAEPPDMTPNLEAARALFGAR